MNIKTYISKSLFLLGLTMISGVSSYAGNDQRAGQAGAPEILINPWAATAGWGLASTSGVTGLEAAFSNVAGMSRLNEGEIQLGVTVNSWLADAKISAGAFATQVGEDATFGLSITSVNFGDIIRTTEEVPEGNSTFSFSTTIVGAQYAKNFTENISGGIGVKMISQGTSDLNTSGLALDLGVQYFAGDNNELKFGIAFKNIGSKMRYSGDGDDSKLTTPSVTGTDFDQNYEYRLDGFELPTQMIISGSYDFILDTKNRITPALAFTSNSFTKDIISLGAEYAYDDRFKLHVGYDYQSDGFKSIAEGRTSALTGLAAGFEVDIPMGEDSNRKFSLAYAYRSANPLDPIHGLTLKFSL